MADDRSKQDNRGRSRIAAEEDYEVRFFAQEAGISVEQAKELIERHGNDRELLNEKAAQILKKTA